MSTTTELLWQHAPTPIDQIRTVVEAFRSRYGYEPDGVWGAPGRVNLLGEHIDYNGGTVLPLALPHRTLVAAAARGDHELRASSRQEKGEVQIPLASIRPGAVSGWFSYVAGVPWAMGDGTAERFPGADLLIDSSVPVGAGLSSSAALECSVALTFDALASTVDAAREPLAATDGGRARLAAACIRAENEIAGASTGGMDQSISLLAERGAVLVLDCRTFDSRPLPLDLDAAGLALLVIDTRAPHQLADGQYARRRAACELAARALGVSLLRDLLPEKPTPEDVAPALARWDAVAGGLSYPEGLSATEVRRLLRHVVTEIVRVEECIALFGGETPAPGAPEWAELGRLLSGSHASLRDDYRVSCPELDLAVKAAEANGALGARMTGGGFGGSAIALVPVERVDAVADAVTQSFAEAGYTAPAFLDAVPAAPARQEL